MRKILLERKVTEALVSELPKEEVERVVELLSKPDFDGVIMGEFQDKFVVINVIIRDGISIASDIYIGNSMSEYLNHVSLFFLNKN